jgi:hypothetical protein
MKHVSPHVSHVGVAHTEVVVIRPPKAIKMNAREVTSLAVEARVRLIQLDRALAEIDDEGYGACQ